MNTIDPTRYTLVVIELVDDDYGQPMAAKTIGQSFDTLAEAEAAADIRLHCDIHCLDVNIKLPTKEI